MAMAGGRSERREVGGRVGTFGHGSQVKVGEWVGIPGLIQLEFIFIYCASSVPLHQPSLHQVVAALFFTRRHHGMFLVIKTYAQDHEDVVTPPLLRSFSKRIGRKPNAPPPPPLPLYLINFSANTARELSPSTVTCDMLRLRNIEESRMRTKGKGNTYYTEEPNWLVPMYYAVRL
eukprot:scaffold16757_cov168-Skeletonema_dohrnii-CCMP3373.AAC.1